jgi:glycosyltransferase involved in cell wall biosynthesis
MAESNADDAQGECMPVTSSNGNSHPFTIAFDTWPLLSKFRKTGIYVYSRNLLSHFRSMAANDQIEVRPMTSSAIENDANEFAETGRFRPYQTNLLRVGRAWRYGGACVSAFRSKADLLFCPSGTTFPVSALVPVVSTIHDVTPVVFPAFPKKLARGLRFAFSNTTRFSRAIITDSDCSKRDLMRVFGLPEASVHVIYLGCDDAIFNSEPANTRQQDALLKKFALNKPFILHHGTIQPRKNLTRLIEAYRLALSRNRTSDFDLVLVGETGWQFEETLTAANLGGARGRVVLTGPLSDPELAALLKAATTVVIPSLYEGFCLPLLESMACGTPTICSSASCLPEISGGVLRYFDPLSLDDMATRIDEVFESAALRDELSVRGKERASSFSWRRCAEETLAVLKSAARN